MSQYLKSDRLKKDKIHISVLAKLSADIAAKYKSPLMAPVILQYFLSRETDYDLLHSSFDDLTK